MSLHIWHRQGPCKPSNCTTFTLNSYWGRAATGQQTNKKTRVNVCRVASVVSSSLQPCRLWPARLLCQGGSPGKNTGVYWPTLVAIPF